MAKKISVEEYNEITNKKQEPKKEKKKRDKLKICSLIINVALIIGIVALIIMYLSLKENSVSKDEYDSMVEYKDDIIGTLELDSKELEEVLNGKTSGYVRKKLEFMDENIVFQIEGFGNRYYSYDCMMRKVSDSYSYWAYNKEAAISEGLRAGGC